MHVTVVQKVVPIEPAEEPRLFHPALLWQVHAPVDVLVHDVVSGKGRHRPGEDTPVRRRDADGERWHSTNKDQHRPIPPCHRDGLAVIVIDQVVGVIRLEGLMMHDCVSLEGVAKRAHWAMHDVLVQRPLKERGEGDVTEKTDPEPENEIVHEQ